MLPILHMKIRFVHNGLSELLFVIGTSSTNFAIGRLE